MKYFELTRAVMILAVIDLGNKLYMFARTPLQSARIPLVGDQPLFLDKTTTGYN